MRPPIDRRTVLQATALLGCSTLAIEGVAEAESLQTVQPRSLLAQEFTIPIRIPAQDMYIHDPGVQIFPNGHIFVVAPVRRRKEIEKPGEGPWPQATSLLLARSNDHGQSWEQLPSIAHYRDATPIVHHDALYLIIPDYSKNQVAIIRSTDEGSSWSKPSVVLKEQLWNCQTSLAERDNYLYWALTSYPNGNTLKAVAIDLDKDLMDPTAWQVSSGCELPQVPALLKDASTAKNKRSWHRPWSADTWLEPNVVNVNGRLLAISRVVTDDFATAGLGAVCEIVRDGTSMKVDFLQFHPMPGGQCKFMIVYDQPSRLFWMLANTPTDSHDLFARGEELINTGFVAGPGNERRILTLHYAVDALNWFPAGVVAMWPSPLQAFMYPSAVIDQDDLVFISRTSHNAPNQHDADIVTFHRIRDLRSLAVDLHSK